MNFDQQKLFELSERRPLMASNAKTYNTNAPGSNPGVSGSNPGPSSSASSSGPGPSGSGNPSNQGKNGFVFVLTLNLRYLERYICVLFFLLVGLLVANCVNIVFLC